jgi:hypothetical protein
MNSPKAPAIIAGACAERLRGCQLIVRPLVTKETGWSRRFPPNARNHGGREKSTK